MKSCHKLQCIKSWFDYRKLYTTTDEESQFKGIIIRCTILTVLMLASLLCKWFCIPLVLFAILFIAFENSINKILYILFLFPFYNVFRMNKEMFWIAYLLAFVVILLGIQILIKYITKKEKMPWLTLVVIGVIVLYFVLPLRPTNLSTIVVVFANVALLSVCYLGKWKFDLKLFTRIFVIGLIVASLMGLPLNHIDRLRIYVGQFEAGIEGVYRFCGLDADPNYYSMNIVLSLGLYTLLYIRNKVSFREFLIVLLVLLVFGFMTISKSYIIVLAVYLLILAILIIMKNHKNLKQLVKKTCALVLVLFISATASISYINYTFKRISWTFAPLQKYDSIVFDVGDLISYAYLKSIESPKVEFPCEKPSTGNDVCTDGAGNIIDGDDGISVGNPDKKPEQNFKTEIITPSVTVLTTGRSDIWKAYFTEITDGSMTRLLFGTDATNSHANLDGVGEVASHKTIIQVMYYYGDIGLLLIIGLICFLFFKNLKKYNFNLVNLLPAFLYCIDLMALDNLTSMRTPIFICLLSISIFYGCNRKGDEVQSEDKISVVVPVYNSEKTLKTCVNSILCQTYKNLEVILVNDGSRDNSLEICKELAKEDNRIVILSKENGGVSSTRNKGIELATGKYICFIDSDDYIEQDYIELLYKGINGHELAMCGYTRVNTDLIYENHINEESLTKKALYNCFGVYYKKDIINSPCNKLYLRELMTNRFDTSLSLGEDLLFNLEYIDRCNTIKTVDSVGYNYVQTGISSLTGKYNKEKFEVILTIYNYCINKFESEDSKRAISTVLIRNACGQFRKYFKSKQESKDEKLKFITEYMSKVELSEALCLAEGQNLKQKLSFWLLKNKKYKLIYVLYKII